MHRWRSGLTSGYVGLIARRAPHVESICGGAHAGGLQTLIQRMLRHWSAERKPIRTGGSRAATCPCRCSGRSFRGAARSYAGAKHGNRVIYVGKRELTKKGICDGVMPNSPHRPTPARLQRTELRLLLSPQLSGRICITPRELQ